MSEIETKYEGRIAWGMATSAVSRVIEPRSVEDVVRAFALAREQGLKVTAWGNGRSYGDAALNDGELVLDMGRMDAIERWDPATGLVTVQPGVTIRKLWQRILPDSYWPPVVSGTMTTTLGGCAAANVHGKNNWKHGPIGEHIVAFTLVTPDGTVREVTRESDPNLFHAAIGGFGALGVFTSITLKAKKVYSGRIDVDARACRDLDDMFDHFERYNGQGWDYVVGWIDAFPSGSSLGRGNMHAANYVPAGADPEGARMLSVGDQELPLTIMGFPKRWMWRLMKPWAHRPGMRFINWGRYFWSSLDRNQGRHLQPHAQFNFLLDFVPDWKRVYEPHGLIQIQLFLPKEKARQVMRQALEVQQAMKLESWLVVMKRHRKDAFWLSHAVDGYSFAMDFPVHARRREDLVQLGRRLEKLVVEAGGRFYLAKDSLVRPKAFGDSLGDEIIGRFLGMKQKLDPDGMLQSNQWRRVLGPLSERVDALPLAEGEVFAVQPQELVENQLSPLTPEREKLLASQPEPLQEVDVPFIDKAPVPEPRPDGIVPPARPVVDEDDDPETVIGFAELAPGALADAAFEEDPPSDPTADASIIGFHNSEGDSDAADLIDAPPVSAFDDEERSEVTFMDNPEVDSDDPEADDDTDGELPTF